MKSIRHLAGLSAAMLVVVGVVSAGALFATDARHEDAPTRAGDAIRVFCLSTERQTLLAQAAASLGVTISEDELRTGKGPEFGRVCAALVGATRIPQQAASSPPDSSRSTFNILLSIIAGAVLTWLTGFWRDERTQSRLLAEAVRSAANNYLSATRAQRRKLAEGRQGRLPVDEAVLDGRDELAAQLRKVAVLRPGWTVPARLHEQLTRKRLGEGMTDLQPGESPQQRDQSLRQDLETLRDPIDDAVRALERPWRWHSNMRGKNPAGMTRVA